LQHHISRFFHGYQPARHSSRRHARKSATPSLCIAVALAFTGLQSLQAHARPPAKAAPQALLDDFSNLATMRPRACPADMPAGIPAPGWRPDAAQCAWQGLLSLRRWQRPAEAAAGSCTGSAAQWWAQARKAYPGAAVPALAWQDAWQSQVLAGESNGVQRLALIARSLDGGWTFSEWTWRPSERAATRRWQEGRWKLLADAVARYRSAAPDTADSGAARLRQAWERNLGARAGEVRDGAWRWQAGAYCLSVEAAGASQGQVRLPYLIEDSRLEQRSAMQLQLARRYPEARWAKTFRPLPGPAQATAGSAKYEAIWQQGDTVKGQLWIPTRNDGPVLRLRVGTRLAPGQAGAADGVAAAVAVVERELAGMAGQWEAGHE
jgi:hypothetical protein